MSTTANVPATLFRVAASDRRLQHIEVRALVALWTVLSPSEYRPLKMESLGMLIGTQRQSASKIVRHLIAVGYLSLHETGDPSQPRWLMLINTMTLAA